MGLLSGLEKMGFKSFDKVDLFAEDKKEVKKKEAKKSEEHKELSEEDLLYDKTMVCPICQHQFKIKAIVGSKTKRAQPDIDMRPRYIGIDTLKYDAVVCHKCGFASLTPYFKDTLLTDNQITLIKEGICASYTSQPESNASTYTYEEAIDNHKLALLNAVVKKTRASEKAYICLKLGWLYRGKSENYSKDASDYNEVIEECKKTELEYLAEAKKGFLHALAHEGGKICGMEPIMVEYLCASISYDLGEHDECLRILSKIIGNAAASTQMKDRCRDLKELLTVEE